MGKKRSTKYTKNVKWVKPFIDGISHLVPVEKLDYIRGYKIRKDFEAAQYGQLTKYSNGRQVLTIKVMDYDKKKKKYVNGYIGNILETLAHETAHLMHWEHTIDHYKLQATIQLAFADIMEKLEIEDTDVRFKIDGDL